MVQLYPPMRGPAWKGSPLREEAYRLDREVRRLSLRIRTHRAELAFLLLEVKRRKVYETLHFTSMTAYGRSVEGLGASTTSELLKVAEACERLPRLCQAFRSGELPLSKAKVLVDVVTPETEGEWLERARRLESSQLQAAARRREPVSRQTIKWTDAQRAVVDDAVRSVREAGGPTDFAAALAAICGDYLDGRSGARGVGDEAPRGGRRKKTVVVIKRCPECDEASRDTQRGPIRVEPAALDEALQEAEVYDMREPPPARLPPDEGQLGRAIPAAVRNWVFARDEGRCQVPGCTHRAHLEADHVKGWKAGHDPDGIVTLCSGHHRQRTKGALRVERHEDERFHFYGVDGEYLGAGGDRVRADAVRRAAPARANPAPAAPAASGEGFARAKDDAVKALRRLEFPAREAKARVERALREDPGLAERPPGELVKAVLVAGWG